MPESRIQIYSRAAWDGRQFIMMNCLEDRGHPWTADPPTAREAVDGRQRGDPSADHRRAAARRGVDWLRADKSEKPGRADPASMETTAAQFIMMNWDRRPDG